MDILTRYREPLAQALDTLLEGPPSPLLTICRYHLGLAEAHGAPTQRAAGKMLRPALCLAMCEALGGDVRQCLPAALSLEVTHRTSLVFDDIQDRSPQRNHRPTIWGTWGTDQAINAGLALSCYARLALHGMAREGASPETVLHVHRVLEGTVLDLCRGQYLDLDFGDRLPALDEYLEMVRLKTGVLVGAACEVGAIVAGTSDEVCGAARGFGEQLGVAFQLQDDNLGVWGAAEVMGKAPTDVEDRKRGLPFIVGVTDASGLADLLATPSANVSATAAIYEGLATPTIRNRAESVVDEAAAQAIAMLHQVRLPADWEAELEEMAQFVAARTS